MKKEYRCCNGTHVGANKVFSFDDSGRTEGQAELTYFTEWAKGGVFLISSTINKLVQALKGDLKSIIILI